MSRETLAALITALQPLLLALITAAAAWGAAAIRRRTKDARVLSAVDVVTRGAEGVVADLSQNLVQDLKDPTKPGSWDQIAKQSARRVAVERVRRLFPGDVAALDAALGRERAEELLGTLVERAVVTQKRGASLAVGELLSVEPPAPSKVPAPIQREGERGSARVGAVAFVLAVGLCLAGLGAVLSGCPNWNRPACPAPGVYSCVADQPHYCAPTKELTPIGDEPCGLQGRVCALTDAGVARCALAPDAAVIVDGGAR